MNHAVRSRRRRSRLRRVCRGPHRPRAWARRSRSSTAGRSAACASCAAACRRKTLIATGDAAHEIRARARARRARRRADGRLRGRDGAQARDHRRLRRLPRRGHRDVPGLPRRGVVRVAARAARRRRRARGARRSSSRPAASSRRRCSRAWPRPATSIATRRSSSSAPPKSLIVLGGGYVGCELGQFYARIGVPTTIVIRSGQLLTDEDADVGEGADASISARKASRSRRSAQRAARQPRDDGRKVVHYTQDGVEKAIAARRDLLRARPRAERRGLEPRSGRRRVSRRSPGSTIDDTLRTSQPHIFAVGDVTGALPLVHVAIQQGELAARNAVRGTRRARRLHALQNAHGLHRSAGRRSPAKRRRSCSAPERRISSASYPFNDHGKAISIGKTKGFVKMMAAPNDGRILGAAILGPDGSDLDPRSDRRDVLSTRPCSIS